MTTTMNPITRKAEKHNLLGRKEAAPGLGCPVKARCRLSFACPDSGSKNLRFYRSQDLDTGSPLYMDQFIDSCVAVKSGQLTGQFFSDNGREETLTLHGAGRVVQPLGILYSVEPLPWLQAVTDSTICILSREHVLDLVNANIELER